IEAGSFLAIRTLPTKPDPSSIFTNDLGGCSTRRRDYIISADEKTSIQARRRKQPTLPPAPNRPTRLAFDVLKVETWVGRMVSEDTVDTNCLLPDCGREFGERLLELTRGPEFARIRSSTRIRSSKGRV